MSQILEPKTASTTEPTPTGWRHYFNRQMAICVMLGFTSGLPLFILYNLLSAWLKSEHVDLKNEKFYLIATEKGKVSTIQHEIAHALYHLDDNYKEKMDGFSAQLPKDLMKTFWEKLNALGYGDNVVHDEFQAYLSTSDEPYMKERFNFGFDGIEELVGKMKEVINQCANEEQILEKINKETVLVKPKLKM